MPEENKPRSNDPDPVELSMLSLLGRLDRLKASGMDSSAAIQRLLKEETADEYLERNRLAMEETERRILSPEYMAKWSDAYREPDPILRDKKLADLKRENFASLDLTAVHRVIAARNRQMRAEGLLPPDSPA